MRLLKVVVCTACAIFASVAHAQSCYQSYITTPSPFMGNNDEIFKLADGSIWQVKYEYEYLYAYSPEVVICPGRGKLIINGKQLQVELLSGESSRSSAGARASKRATLTGQSVDHDNSDAGAGSLIETRIDGEFTGWDGETVFKLANGQIWQQTQYAYTYHYAYSPKVIIFRSKSGYQMHVDGVDTTIGVARLK